MFTIILQSTAGAAFEIILMLLGAALIGDVQIDHGCGERTVTEILLYDAHADSGLDQMRGIAVAARASKRSHCHAAGSAF